MNFKEKTAVFLGTGLYIGRIPVMPGTFGSGLGLLLCFTLSCVPLIVAANLVIGFIIVSIWISQEAEKSLGQKDPGCIVIDEMAGMVVTLLGMPFTITTVVTGFFLFRLLDIVKPPPIRFIQDTFEGGAGVVMDDVAAGVAGNIILQLLFR